jgi:hypothetical protein
MTMTIADEKSEIMRRISRLINFVFEHASDPAKALEQNIQSVETSRKEWLASKEEPYDPDGWRAESPYPRLEDWCEGDRLAHDLVAFAECAHDPAQVFTDIIDRVEFERDRWLAYQMEERKDASVQGAAPDE